MSKANHMVRRIRREMSRPYAAPLLMAQLMVIAFCVAFVVAIWFVAQRGEWVTYFGGGVYASWLYYKERKAR